MSKKGKPPQAESIWEEELDRTVACYPETPPQYMCVCRFMLIPLIVFQHHQRINGGVFDLLDHYINYLELS